MSKSLYNFESDSLHAKFFSWLWNIDDIVNEYPGMCPYFWQYLGTIIILPLVLVWKLFSWILTPINTYIQIKLERDAKIYVAKLLKEIENAKTEEDYYNIFKQKCWIKYRFKWDKDTGDNYFTDDIRNTIRTQSYFYERELDRKNLIRKQKLQKQIDEFKYGKTGTVLSYIVGLVVLVGLGFFFYWFVHLFTLDQFVNFWIILGKLVIAVGIVCTVFWIAYTLTKTIACDTPMVNVVFWKPLGNGIASVFKGIWKFIRIIFDMIGNIIKKNCPRINWN